MANNYNYSEPTLSAGAGGFEERVRSGAIYNKDGAYTPKTNETTDTSIEAISIPQNQRIDDFDKRKAVIYDNTIEGGRGYITYSGRYHIEFLKGNEALAKAYRTDRIKSGESDFNESETETAGRLFTLNNDDSDTKLQQFGLNLASLRRNYDESLELTPFFTAIPRNVDSEVSSKLLYQSLEEYLSELKTNEDSSYFKDSTGNRVRYYFGSTTNDDAGCYVDYAGNVRVSYNNFMTHRCKPLLEDLLSHGATDEDYVIGRYPDGTLQFVLKPSIASKLLTKWGNEENLAKRYNNDLVKPTKVYPKDFDGIENILDVKTSETTSINTIFGIATNTEKK